MEYNGKLYGRLGPKEYFFTGKTSEDWDKMEYSIKCKDEIIKNLRSLLIDAEVRGEHKAMNRVRNGYTLQMIVRHTIEQYRSYPQNDLLNVDAVLNQIIKSFIPNEA